MKTLKFLLPLVCALFLANLAIAEVAFSPVLKPFTLSEDQASLSLFLPKIFLISPDGFILDRSEVLLDVVAEGSSYAISKAQKDFIRLGRATHRISPTIATFRVYINEIKRFKNYPLDRVELVWKKRPLLDLSGPDVKADVAHSGETLPQPFDGTGVLVGILDTGIEFHHPAFNDSEGKTRILYYWDQDKSQGPHPKGYEYGTEWTSEDIEDDTCNSIDLIGHGTHVSSIAAGKDNPYMGMAPNAGIIMVRSYSFEQLIDANKYMVEKADELGKPIVINMSLGGHAGPHDGTSLEEQALDELTGPGKIIVAAAGNEGADLIHLSYTATEKPQKTYLYLSRGVLSEGEAYMVFYMDEAGELEVNFNVEQEDAIVGTHTPFKLSKESSSYGEYAINSASDELLGNVTMTIGDYTQNNRIPYVFIIQPSDNPNTFSDNEEGYNFVMQVKGNAYFDAWMVATEMFGESPAFLDETGDGIVPGDNKESVGMPATATKLIAVGAYVTRNEWTTKYGDTHSSDVMTSVGDYAYFTSQGPSARPEITGLKPEISAPGSQIIGAISFKSGELEEGTRIDGRHIIMQGTSMASPHATGIIALMLQANPDLTPDDVEEIFRLTARADSFTMEVPNDIWGYGKINAVTAVKSALGLGACSEIIKCEKDRECVSGWCKATEEGAFCNLDNDCKEPLVCIEKVCAEKPEEEPADAGVETEGKDGGTTNETGDDDDDDGCGCRVR